jgi:hypothetical protein
LWSAKSVFCWISMPKWKIDILRERKALLELECYVMKTRTVLIAVAGGVLLTLLTGLLPNTPEMMVGATHYGYPLAWLIRMIVAPQYFPWVIDYLGLLADVIFWAIIAAIVLLAIGKARKKAV